MSNRLRVAIVVSALAFGCSSPTEEENHDHEAHDHGLANRDAGDAGNVHDEDAEHAADLAGVDIGAEATISPAAEQYCECLLITCHDPFHEKYGEDDVEAIAACELESSALPAAGSAQMSGNSIECRQYQCDNVGADISCDDALGAACM